MHPNQPPAQERRSAPFSYADLGMRWLACALAALGLWLSIDLWRLGSGVSATNPLLRAQCDPGPAPLDGAATSMSAAAAAQHDCSSVLTSSWGSVPLSSRAGAPRIPLAAVGVGYFSAVLLWLALVGLPGRVHRGWAVLITLVALAAAWQSLELTWVMASQLKAWCVGCVAVHIVNAVLLLLLLATFPWRASSAVSGTRPSAAVPWSAACAGLAVFFLPLAIALANAHAGALSALNSEYLRIINDPEYARWEFARQPRVDLPLYDAPGAPPSPHTLVMFGDLQCPMCRIAHETARTAQKRWPGRLRLVFRHFPLDRSCNGLSARTMHPSACAAARALEAATQVGGAAAREKMLDLLYQHGERLATGAWSQWAAECGIDAAAFAAALAAPESESAISGDLALAKQLEIRATPMLFLDGRRFSAWRNIETWGALLEGEPGAGPQ